VPDAGRQEPAVELLLRFARLGHDAGYPTADLEERILALAEALGVSGSQVSATPTVVDLSIGTLSSQRSYTLRVRPSAVELDAIARLRLTGCSSRRSSFPAASRRCRLAGRS
jgi:uncharacterized membrane protein YjjP (DUF1212 family)